MINYPSKKIIIFTYLILPLLIFIPLMILTSLYGEFTFHWFLSVDVDTKQVLFALLKFILISFPIIFFATNIKLNQPKFFLSLIAILFFLLYIIVDFTYIKTLSLLLFIMIAAKFRIHNLAVIFMIFTSIAILFARGGDRFAVVIPLLLFLIYLRPTYKSLFLYIFSGILFLVFILQPIRSDLTIEEFLQVNGILYVFQHFQPIFLSCFFYLEYTETFLQSLISSFPFARTLFDMPDTLIFLKQDFVNLGYYGDFGSNSTALSFPFIIIIYLFFFIIKFANIFIKQSVMIYLVIYSPYFLRRSFTAFINEILILIIFCLIYLFIRFFLTYKYEY